MAFKDLPDYKGKKKSSAYFVLIGVTILALLLAAGAWFHAYSSFRIFVAAFITFLFCVGTAFACIKRLN